MTDRADIFDVAIAGAGPAGSSAAIRLAQSGLRVVLIEQKRFPREKLCGEFVSPECLDHFNELGVHLDDSGGTDIDKTVFYAPSGRALTFPASWLKGDGSQAMGVSRLAMDKALIDRARAVGVDVREGTSVKRACNDGARVTGLLIRAGSTETTIQAAVVIDARGRAKPFIEPDPRPHRAARLVAFKAHLAGARTEHSTCEMFVYPGGYGGCLPIEKGLHNLCFIAPASAVVDMGSEPEQCMRSLLMRNRRAAEALAQAEVVGDWHAVPIQGLGRRDPVHAQGLLAIGDAAAFIDPFTGSGILLAFQSGKLAAETIIHNYPNIEAVGRKYRQYYDLNFNRRLTASSVLRYAFRSPALAELALLVLRPSEWALRRLASATRSEDHGSV